MKKKIREMIKRKKKPAENEVSEKGNLVSLSEYFGSYLNALEIVNARH